MENHVRNRLAPLGWTVFRLNSENRKTPGKEVLTRLWDYTDSLLTQNTMPSLQSAPISLWKHLHLNRFAAASPSNLHLSKMCLVLALLLLFFLGGYHGQELPIFWGRHGGGDHSRGSGAKRQFTTQSSPTSQKKQRRA